jgi:hypothetical protein
VKVCRDRLATTPFPGRAGPDPVEIRWTAGWTPPMPPSSARRSRHERATEPSARASGAVRRGQKRGLQARVAVEKAERTGTSRERAPLAMTATTGTGPPSGRRLQAPSDPR